MNPDSFTIIDGVSKLFAGAVGVVGVIFGFGVAWGISQAKAKQNKADIDQIKKECPIHRENILNQVCKKIDKIYNKLDEMNNSREEARIELAEFIGRTKGGGQNA